MCLSSHLVEIFAKVQNLIDMTPSLENFLETRVVCFWNFQARWGAASGFLPANDIASNFSQWKLFILILWNNSEISIILCSMQRIKIHFVIFCWKYFKNWKKKISRMSETQERPELVDSQVTRVDQLKPWSIFSLYNLSIWWLNAYIIDHVRNDHMLHVACKKGIQLKLFY